MADCHPGQRVRFHLFVDTQGKGTKTVHVWSFARGWVLRVPAPVWWNRGVLNVYAAESIRTGFISNLKTFTKDDGKGEAWGPVHHTGYPCASPFKSNHTCLLWWKSRNSSGFPVNQAAPLLVDI